MDELQERIARLPAWAREHIKRLHGLPQALADEAANLRRKVTSLEERNRKLSDQVEAMTEMFRYAALGGSKAAKTIVSTLEGYEIFPPAKQE